MQILFRLSRAESVFAFLLSSSLVSDKNERKSFLLDGSAERVKAFPPVSSVFPLPPFYTDAPKYHALNYYTGLSARHEQPCMCVCGRANQSRKSEDVLSKLCARTLFLPVSLH